MNNKIPQKTDMGVVYNPITNCALYRIFTDSDNISDENVQEAQSAIDEYALQNNIVFQPIKQAIIPANHLDVGKKNAIYFSAQK